MNNQSEGYADEGLGGLYRSQPEIRHLCFKLLSVGGQEVELTSLPDRDLPILLALGERFTGTAVHLVKRGSSSFRNVALLWLAREGPIIAIGAGYALARNNVWHPHAWGIENGAIIETTEAHIDYFGCYLTGGGATAFALKHAPALADL